MKSDELESLNVKVDELIGLCADMKREIQLLKADENTWKAERRELLDKNRDAKTRLESVLVRLKAMGNF